MADDIEIDIKVELEQALKNLQELTKAIKTVKKSVDSELDPSINNVGTKLVGAGNKVSGFGSKLQNAISGPTALAFTALGAGMTSFTKQCIDSAISSEAAWTRFGALVNQSGGNWKQQSNDIKGWATEFSNSMGYAVSDTREAATAFMQFGLSVDQMKTAMNATAGVAARTGMTEAEASSMVISALNGKGKQLEKMTGLRMEDYKTADGQIDRERLLNDLYAKNQDAIKAHGDTTEAQMNRISNSWGKFKTGIGQALMPAVKMVADFIEKVVNGFNSLKGPEKTIVAVFLAIVAVVTTAIGVLGMIAPIIINVGNLMSSAGKFIGKLKVPEGITGAWKSFKGTLGSVKSAFTGLTGEGGKLQGVKEAVTSSYKKLASTVNSAKKSITGLFSENGKLSGVKDAVTSSWKKLSETVGKAKKAISDFKIAEKIQGIPNSISSGWKSLRESISSAKTAISEFSIAEKLSSAGGAVKGAITSAWTALTGAITGSTMATNVNTGSNAANTASESGSTIAKYAHAVAEGVRTTATNIATAATTALAAATWASVGPILLVVAAIAAFVAILGYLYFNNETVRNSINALVGILQGALMGAWNALKGVISAVANILQSTLGPAINFIMMAFQVLSNTVGQIVNVFSRVMDGSMSLGDAFNAIGGILSNAGTLLWNAAMEAGRQMLEGFKTSVGQAIDGAKTAVSGFIDSVVQFFSELPGKIVETISKIPQMIGDALSSLGDMVIPGGGLVAGILSIFLPIPAAIVGLINNFAPEVIPAITGFIGNVASSFGNFGSSILSSIGDGLGMVRDGIMGFMGGIADTLSSLSNLPVIGPVFDALAGSVRTAASVFGILSNAAIGIVNVFSQVLSGTMSVGDAFNAITGILGGAFSGIQTVIGNFVGTIISNFAGIGQRILQGFLNIPQMLGQFFTLAVMQIQMRLTQARAIAGMLVGMLVNAVVTRFNLLVARVRMVFANVVNAIRSRLSSAGNIASNLANRIRNAIVTRFNRIIAQARSIFQKIVSTIRQRLANAVTAAKDKAQEILQGIKDKVSQIPQAVADEFNKIKDRIATALDNAKNVAVQKIGDLVAAVKGALGIASPGYIQRMTAGEFESIPMHIATQAVNAVREAGKMAESIVDSWYDGMSSLVVPDVEMDGTGVVPVNVLPDLAVENNVLPVDLVPEVTISDALTIPSDMILSEVSGVMDSVNDVFTDWSVPNFTSSIVESVSALPNIIMDNGVYMIDAMTTIAEGIRDVWNGIELSAPSMGLPELPTPTVDTGNMSMLGVDLFRNNSLLQGMNNFEALTMNYEVPTPAPASVSREIVNNNTRDDHQTHIHIDKIELDCNHLTKQESRKILYDALDGLYTGGV